MAIKKGYGWGVASPTKSKSKKIDAAEKSEIELKFKEKLDGLNAAIAKQEKTIDINYQDEFYLSWYRSFLYVCCRYVRLDGQTFDEKTGRIGFDDDDTASTAYMRHTDQWWTIHEGLCIEDAIKEVLDNEIYWA